MLSAWSVDLPNEIQSEKMTFGTKSSQHLIIQDGEHMAHDQKNTAHLLASKRGKQFTNYQEQVSYNNYCKLLLASLCRAKFLASTSVGSRPLPSPCLPFHYSPPPTDRHYTQSSTLKKSQRNEQTLIKSHLVRSETPRNVTTYIINYTASRYRTQ